MTKLTRETRCPECGSIVSMAYLPEEDRHTNKIHEDSLFVCAYCGSLLEARGERLVLMSVKQIEKLKQEENEIYKVLRKLQKTVIQRLTNEN